MPYHPSTRRIRWPGAIAVGLALVASACGGGGDDAVEAGSAPATTDSTVGEPTTAAGPGTTSTSTTTATTTTAPAEPVLDVVPYGTAVLPRTATYSLMELTVTAVEVSNADPFSRQQGRPEPGDGYHAWVSIDVVNGSSARMSLAFSGVNGSPLVSLEVGDDLIAPLDRYSEAPGLIEGRTTTTMTLAYELPGPDVDLAQAALVIGTQGKVPARITLGGSMPPVEYPKPLAFDPTPGQDARGAGTGCNQALTVSLVDGTLLLDHPDEVPIAGAAGFSYTRRADAGTNLLLVHFQIQNHGGELCGGGGDNVDNADFRLVVDGAPTPPLSFTNVSQDDGTTLTHPVVFAVPDDLDTVELVVGDPAVAAARFTVDLTAVERTG